MVTLTEQLSRLNIFESIILIKDRIVEGINSIINGFSSGNPIAVVFLISILIGIGVKRWKKLKWAEGIVIMILVFGTIRWIGIGG